MKKYYSILHTGFTLIELLVVISIIGILATLISANLNSARSRARDAQRKSDVKNTQTALRLYFNDMSVYPNGTSGVIQGCGALGTSACPWGDEWSIGNTIYMNKLPVDPISTQSYKYELGSDSDTFKLSACLENKSDTGGIEATDTSWCPSGWQFQIDTK